MQYLQRLGVTVYLLLALAGDALSWIWWNWPSWVSKLGIVLLVGGVGYVVLTGPLHPSSLPTLLGPDLEPEIAHWEEWRRVQPNHRDILLKLSALHLESGQSDQAAAYLELARELDPLHPQVASLGGRLTQ